MKIIVFGANGQTGRLVVEQAVSHGHEVTAVVRRPEEFTTAHSGVRVAQADAMDAEAVDRVVPGHDAVISTIGGEGYTKERVTVYSRTIAHIITAMHTHGLRRVACIGSTGVTFQSAPGENLFRRFVIYPMLLRMGRTVYEDNARMEENLRASNLDWTVVRAAGLFDRETRTNYAIREPNTRPAHFTARIDLADALIRAVLDNHHNRTAVEAVTTEGTPRLVNVLLHEAFGRARWAPAVRT